MRSLALNDVGRAVRAGIVALGLFALTAPAVFVLSSPAALARESGGDKVGDDKGGTGSLGGLDRFSGNEASRIVDAFDSLTPPQQQRVMQRCRDVIARPAQADSNHLAVCQTLMAMARR